MSDTEEVFELDDRKAEIVPALHKHEGIWTISHYYSSSNIQFIFFHVFLFTFQSHLHEMSVIEYS